MLTFKVSAVHKGPPKPMERWRGFKPPPKNMGVLTYLKMQVFLGGPWIFFQELCLDSGKKSWSCCNDLSLNICFMAFFHDTVETLSCIIFQQIKITSDSMVPYSVTPPEEIPLHEMIHQSWCCHCKIPFYEWWWWWWWWWYFLKDIETCKM